MAVKMTKAAIIKKGPPGRQRASVKVAGIDVSYWVDETGQIDLDVRMFYGRDVRESIAVYVDGIPGDLVKTIEWMYENREELAHKARQAKEATKVKGTKG